MDLQTLSGKPVTSENTLSPNNFHPYSPQTADVSRGQPDTHGRVVLLIDGVKGMREPPNSESPSPNLPTPKAGNEWGARWRTSPVHTRRIVLLTMIDSRERPPTPMRTSWTSTTCTSGSSALTPISADRRQLHD
jgi:hypothetical protein